MCIAFLSLHLNFIIILIPLVALMNHSDLMQLLKCSVGLRSIAMEVLSSTEIY